MMDPSGWNTHAQPMEASPTDDDYADFLDLDFDAFEATAAAATAEDGSAHSQLSQGGVEVPMEASTSLPTTAQAQTSLSFGEADRMLQSLHQNQKMQQQLRQLQQQMHSQQQQHQFQQFQHQRQLQLQMQLQQCGFGQGSLSQVQQHAGGYLGAGAGGIPATPQSLEISPAAPVGAFFSPHDHAMLNVAYHGLGSDSVAFSPLVSPAVTPLDQSFSLADSAYAMHSTTFSPLVSPALHATTDSPLMFANRHHSSSNTAGSSPAEMDLDALPPPAPVASNDTVRKMAAPKSGAAASKPARSNKPSVRQSPIVKPQHRRKPTSTSQVATHILQELQISSSSSSSSGASGQRPGLMPQPARPSTAASSARSRGSVSDENASVSPEPLSEMPPPPLPSKSATHSPYIIASDKAPPMALPPRGTMPPATPASLMRLAASTKASPTLESGSSSKSTSPPDGIDDFKLPPPVKPPSESPKRTGSQVRLAPATTESIAASSSASGASWSANSTPYLGPTQSACTTPRQTPQIQPKPGRKLAGTSTASPALLPKLSPAIRPLLPLGPAGATTAEDEASRLLASKSNYTRILEGSNVLSYPSGLATGLNSKRTSHKLAEQGRRNRMNTAIQQIATLLPPGNPQTSVDDLSSAAAAAAAAATTANDDDDDDGGGGGSGKKDGKNAPNSKAHTVERAMEYIRELQGQLDEATRRAERAERLLGERGGGGGGSSGGGGGEDVETSG